MCSAPLSALARRDAPRAFALCAVLLALDELDLVRFVRELRIFFSIVRVYFDLIFHT